MIIRGNENIRKCFQKNAPMAAAVTSMESGTLCMLNAAGEIVACTDPTKKGFPFSSDLSTKKDNVTDKGRMGSFAIGSCSVFVDAGSFNTGSTFNPGTYVMAGAGGKLFPFDSSTAANVPAGAVLNRVGDVLEVLYF